MSTADLSVLLDQLKKRPQIRGPVVIVALAEVAQAAEREAGAGWGLSKEATARRIQARRDLRDSLARLRQVLTGEEEKP